MIRFGFWLQRGARSPGTRDAVAFRRALPLVLLAALLAFITYAQPYRNGPPIRSDGVGYHAWTHALLKRDFTFCSWKDPNFISHTDAARGVCANKYPPGMALLQLPVMAALVDLGPAAPRISRAEHLASSIIAAVVLWLIALLLTWSAAMMKVPPGRAACVVMFTLFGTGLVHYSTYDGAYTHSRSALFCALLLAFALRERVRGRAIPAIVLFTSGFFLVAIRNTNVLLLGPLVVAYAISHRALPRRALIQRGLPLAAGVGVAVAIQLVYNYYALGAFHLSSYGQETFRFDQPMQAEVLLSYERGLFTYYPVFMLALVLGAMVRPARLWTLLLAVVIALYATLYGFWHMWFLGGGMGHRGFVELAPLVAFILLIVARDLRPRIWVPSAVVGTALTLLTVQVMFGYWLSTFPFEHASAETYWKHARTLESLVTGGTFCRRSECDLLQGECKRVDEPEFTPCYAGIHPGSCTGQGMCAPIVTLRSLSRDNRTPYVTTAQRGDKRHALSATAAKAGRWEKYWLIPVDGDRILLRSVATRRYVTAPVGHGAPRPLAAEAAAIGPWESFTRVGPNAAVALRAWTDRYVTARSDDPSERALIATSDTIGERERFAIEPTPFWSR